MSFFIRVITASILFIGFITVHAQYLTLEKKANPQKQRVVRSSEIDLKMLDGTSYRLSNFSLTEDLIISGSDTILIKWVSRIKCKTRVGTGQNIAGYSMSAAGAFLTFTGVVGLALVAGSDDSYLFPKQPIEPPIAMLASGIVLGTVGYHLTGMDRSYNLATSWRLKVITPESIVENN